MKTVAKVYAILAHGDQEYGSHPYSYHLERVAKILEDAGYVSEFWQSVGWLHDTLEDTTVTRLQLEKFFDAEVASTVFSVSGFGKNRKERNQCIYDNLAVDPKARILKLADRIANVEQSILEKNAGKFKMYSNEHYNFFLAVQEGNNATLLMRYLDAIDEGQDKGLHN